MQVDRSLSSRFAFPQNRAEWEQVFARVAAALAKVPLDRWQFLVRLLLVIVLSYSLARLLWLLVPAPKIPEAAIALPTVINHISGDGSSVNIAQLKSLAVFGKVQVAPKPDTPPIIENQAVDTHLNLVLMGVISSNEDAAARAIIASGDKQDVYAIGQALPVGNGVTLSKVMPDRVIINNNGQYESLWLYQNDPNAPEVGRMNEPVAASEPPQQAIMPRGRPGPSPEVQMPPNNDGPMGGAAEVSRTLSDVVAMSIYREGGQVVGYKIRPGRDAEKFRSLGLQTDDIVTAINGMPLTNPAKIMEVYKSMGNTTSASLEIKRGGNVMTIDVVLQ